MCELDDYWTNEVHSNSVASHQTNIRHEVHVLLVDHMKESLVSIANMLEMCSYKVTMVELPSAAMAMLAKGGEQQFDIVMANIHTPEYQGFKLLEEALNRGVPVILMSSANEDDLLARRALECGASLYIKYPTCMEVVKCLWQFVVKERLKNKGKNTNGKRADSKGKLIHPNEETPAKENNAVEDDGKKNKKGKRKANNPNGSNKNGNNDNHSVKLRRKVSAHWSKELHGKFLEVVNQLGEGKCYPKDILQRMDVPGLTRMQVASHLQKCRNDKWRPPRERGNEAVPPREKDSSRSFGSIPRACILSYQQQQQQNQEKSANRGINSGSGNRISADERGESSNTQSSLGLNSSVQNSGMFHGISTEGIGIGNGNGCRIPTSTAMETNFQQPYGTNLPAFHSAANVTNSQSNLPSARQADDDFFEIPDLDYLMQNFSGLQQGSGTNHSQSQPIYSFEEIFSD